MIHGFGRTGRNREAGTIVKFEGENLRRENRRMGPGWWMDVHGTWRSPEQWPEDYPPLPGWVRNSDGGWLPPREAPGPTRWTRLDEDDDPIDPDVESLYEPAEESVQASADKRAMLTVTGALAAIALLLAGAMILISQAGADSEELPPPSTEDVIFAAETDQALASQRREAAELAPGLARTALAALPAPTAIPDSAPRFDADDWHVPDEGCLSIAEQALILRSSEPVTFVDQLECVPDTGKWVDRAHGHTMTRVIDANVVPFVPLEVAHASGGWAWSKETKAAFASDLAHPATLQVVAAGFGHNPRSQDPSAWRPAAQSQWCAYAVDWIAVKTRWSLSVTPQERSALASMLDTCNAATSAGADPATVVLSELEPPPITPLPQ